MPRTSGKLCISQAQCESCIAPKPHPTHCVTSPQKPRLKLDSNQSSHGIIRWLLRPTDPSAGTVSELAPGMEGMAKSHHTEKH